MQEFKGELSKEHPNLEKERGKLLSLFFRAHRCGEHYFSRMARCRNLFRINFNSPESTQSVQEFWARSYLEMRELATYSVRLKGALRAKLRVVGVVPREREEEDGRQNSLSL